MTFFVAGAVLVGGAYSARQAGEAADDATAASGAALDEQRRQFDTVREDTRIARETGNDALMTLGYLLGVRAPPSQERIDRLERQIAEAEKKGKNSDGFKGAAINDSQINALRKNLAEAKKGMAIAQRYPNGIGDFIRSQPGYQFGLDEGNRAVTNNLTAGGQSQGGKALKAAERYGIDYAGSQTDQHLSRLFTLAGYGPAGANTSANAGQNLANASANHAGVVGDAAFGQAGANIGAVNNALNTGLSLWAYNNTNRAPPRTNLTSVPQGSVNPNIGATA